MSLIDENPDRTYEEAVALMRQPTGPVNPRRPVRYQVPITGSIGAVRKSILDRALANLGEMAMRAGNVADLVNTGIGLAVRGKDSEIPDASKVIPAGELTGLTSGGSGLVDQSNGLPLVRMERGLMSLQADPRVIDAAGIAAPVAGLAGKAALRTARVLPGAIKDAAVETVAAGMPRIWSGPKSKTWDAAAAQAFEEGEKAGISPRYLWKETGTARVKDGSLIQEIDDSKARLLTDFTGAGKPLREVIDHPDFAAAYPDLMDGVTVRLEVDRGMKSRGHGSYDSDKRLLTVTAPDIDDARRVILHEMNHSVSRNEGRATGGSPDKASRLVSAALADPKTSPELRAKLKEIAYDDYEGYARLQDEVLSRRVEGRRDLSAEERADTYPTWDRDPADWIVTRDDQPGISMAYSGGEGGPKKTRKAYKLFRVDPNQPGKLFPLFVDSTTEVPIGQWTMAKQGYPFTLPNGRKMVVAKTGSSYKLTPELQEQMVRDGIIKEGVTTVKAVADRAGWHASDLPYSLHLGDTPAIDPVTGKQVLSRRSEDQVWAEVEMPDDKDWQSVAESRASRRKDGSIDPKTAQIVGEVPYGGSYRYKTNPNMKGNWIISGDMRVNRVLSDEEVAALNRAAGVEDLPRHRPLDLSALGFGDTAAPAPSSLRQVAESFAAEKGLKLEPAGRQLAPSEFQPADAATFNSLLKMAREEMIAAGRPRDALQVDAALPKRFKGKAFVTEDGKHGFAVDQNGNIINLFKHPSSDAKNVMGSVLDRARDEGGVTLQAFDTGLAEGYKKRGAVEVGRSPFNPEYAPEGWDPATMGTPDYVEMVLGPRDRAVTKANVRTITQSEPDVGRSFISSMGGAKAAKGEPTTLESVLEALEKRKTYRKEPDVTPGPQASPKEWAAWGKERGVKLTVTKPKEIAPGVSIPGGLDGKFTIADLFELKSLKIDPATLPREVHDALMQKLIRTYDIPNPDPVDVFNRLAFAQLSPNAPLLQNEFLMQRLRATSMDDIKRLASREGQEDLARALDAESGVGAGSRGGMGVKGTADLSNLATLARAVIEKPEMFRARPGETLRDVGLRVMNQIPGLGPKTVSLGVPWLDLPHANTSAVDLHMIRNNYARLLTDSRVGSDFVRRMAGKLKVDDNLDAVQKAIEKNPGAAEDAAIAIIGGSSRAKVYRGAKTGEVNPEVPDSLQPGLLWREPKKATFFNEFYDRIVDFVNESRGADPALALFPEQWRLWDTYRGRIEPHEFAHPDWRKLPKQSFNELQAALKANRAAGFGDTGPKARERVDWRKLYYGSASPDLLALLAAGGAGAASLPLLADDE